MSAYAPLAKSYQAPMMIEGFEAATRRALDEYLKDEKNWSPSVATVAMAFQAMYASALTVERIKALGMAMGSMSEAWDPQPALTQMVRHGILRSRMNAGRRLYEMNY